MADVLYTIGHSTHPAEKVIELLRGHGVTALADVRSHPYSRTNPQFNRESFASRLEYAGIDYFFVGHELGARCEDPSCYTDGKVQYDLFARTALFQTGLDRVVECLRSRRLSLMCAEKDPLTCHRTILVCRRLVARGVKVEHILEDGRIETHDDALLRLLAELGLPEHDLFMSRDEIIEEAYARRGRKIAYTESALSEKGAMPGVGR